MHNHLPAADSAFTSLPGSLKSEVRLSLDCSSRTGRDKSLDDRGEWAMSPASPFPQCQVWRKAGRGVRGGTLLWKEHKLCELQINLHGMPLFHSTKLLSLSVFTESTEKDNQGPAPTPRPPRLLQQCRVMLFLFWVVDKLPGHSALLRALWVLVPPPSPGSIKLCCSSRTQRFWYWKKIPRLLSSVRFLQIKIILASNNSVCNASKIYHAI